jgi:hypothetical protein
VPEVERPQAEESDSVELLELQMPLPQVRVVTVRVRVPEVEQVSA